MELNQDYFSKNYFDVFGIAVSFEVDVADLASRYREVQKQMHPDKFAHATSREQRLAVQFAALVNTAFETLKSPVKRAYYLLELRGLVADGDTTTSDTAFLMQQIELREALSEIRDSSDPEQALDALALEVKQLLNGQAQSFALQLAGDKLPEAQAVAHRMQFLTKLSVEIEQLEAELFDD
ncbi:MAG: Fe-S protein assembly co-chaperone HscB [Cellvibrionaceae bacterium]